MDWISIVLLAFALGIDAFAVSFGAGAFFGLPNKRQIFRLSFHFGLFQFFMPIIGWIAGKTIVNIISDYDHWLAFIILTLIGSKMIWDTLNSKDNVIDKDISKGLSLVALSFATSIDALAVGFSMGLLNSKIFIPSIIIGIVASIMSIIGIKLGGVLSFKLGNKIAIIGGIVLILIGTNIVIEHIIK